MRDRIKEIPKKLLAFWNKYSGKQKTIIISILAAVIVLIAVTAYFVSRPTWVRFESFKSVTDASSMKNALDGASIPNKSSRDGLTLYVHQEDYTKSLYTMSDNGLEDKGYTWDQAFDNSLSTSEAEKSQKRILALQNEIKQSIIQYSFVDDADIFIDVPESTYSVLDQEQATSITARIKVDESNKKLLTDETKAALASWLANIVGTDVSHVIINDSDGNCLYNGATSGSLGGSIAGGAAEYCEKLRKTIASNVTDLLIKSGYDDVQVGTQGIRFNMNEIETLSKEYSVADGREYGYPTNLYTYESSGASGAGGEPGTDSNDSDTDTVILDSGRSSSSVSIQKLTDLLTNETVQNIKQETPAIQYDDSSLGIVVIRYNVIKEKDLEAAGTLANMTFEQYIAQNSARTPITLSDEELSLISMATGVNSSNITVAAYEVPKFVAKEKKGFNISNWLMIILAVLIVALLAYVVLRGTSPVKVQEMEPELSVEELLATTKEDQSLEDIEFSDKSETRKLIEKFVDENPEAVAQLLRNWINDEWD
ncbi:MAG: hypothetical protein VZR00_01015 [Lachnospiraceae bacterium]|jgi:flagellar M-ring protein FliF|nr:hypothetical protein [Lachnospiraceae bacterium]MEE3460457.1 hypothetical protein [Lachnospiraceae bacterium]